MGKITVYLGILSMVLLGLYFSGALETGTSTFLLDALLNPENLPNHSFVSTLLGILTIFGGTVAVIAGLFAPSRFESVATIGFTTLLFVIGGDSIAIYNLLSGFSVMFAVMLIAPMMLLYFLAALEWWRGKD